MGNTKNVVLDAGHGGKDPGAIGINGYKESVKVLSIVNKVKPYLINSGLNVIMTRTSDEFIGINERVRIERKTSNYCFVSIHCNAFDGNASGLEVLYNAPSIKGKALADTIYNQLISDGLYNKKRGTKPRTDLGVLRNTICPSALIETAFIDNSNDFNLLQKEDAFAKSIAKAICSYCGVKFIEGQVSSNPSITKPQTKGESKLLKNCKNQIVTFGEKGTYVYLAQSAMKALGLYNGPIDGSYGPSKGNGSFYQAVINLNAKLGFKNDSRLGPTCWKYLLQD